MLLVICMHELGLAKPCDDLHEQTEVIFIVHFRGPVHLLKTNYSNSLSPSLLKTQSQHKEKGELLKGIVV
jgi:hypothetical protein